MYANANQDGKNIYISMSTHLCPQELSLKSNGLFETKAGNET